MLYVFRSRNSTGARELTEGILLAGLRARRTKGLALRNLQAGDQVVCWGDNFAAPAGIKTLNNMPPMNKFAEAQKLAEKGVATVEVSRTRPAARPVRAARAAFVEGTYNLGGNPRLSVADAHGINTALVAFIAQERQRRAAYDAFVPPVVPAETWLPRKNNHVGGADLLEQNLINPDFYSKKIELVEEYRLHMFRGKSIRAGKKTQRATRPDGRTPAHAWIRSFDAGWVINYDGFQSNEAMRKLGRAALKALDLEFGAIDMGKKADGTLVVLEVNRAPGVEGGTVDAYAKHIVNWANGRDAEGGE